MIEYRSNSRYFGIKENMNVIQEDLVNINVDFTEAVVLVEEENNIELVSQRCYNNPSYWWVICRFNGILNPCNIPIGLKLRIPNIQQIKSRL